MQNKVFHGLMCKAVFVGKNLILNILWFFWFYERLWFRITYRCEPEIIRVLKSLPERNFLYVTLGHVVNGKLPKTLHARILGGVITIYGLKNNSREYNVWVRRNEIGNVIEEKPFEEILFRSDNRWLICVYWNPVSRYHSLLGSKE